MPPGQLVIVLHAHLPYVLGHGHWPHGDAWIVEAAADTYLPLLAALDELVSSGLRPAITLDITPVLGEQLTDDRLPRRLDDHLVAAMAAADRNAAHARATGDHEVAVLSGLERERYEHLRTSSGSTDVLGSFAALDAAGAIELFTSARTHGFLPLLDAGRAAVQVREGAEWFQRTFQRRSRGFWMPECAYRPAGDRPGVAQMLADAGIEWTVVDAHLVTGGAPVGTYPAWSASTATGPTPHRPYLIGGSGVVALPRDPTTTVQVWSGVDGYPADPRYREFHRRHDDGGLRYWRVSGPGVDLGAKERYEPMAAAAAVHAQATHFAELVAGALRASADAGVTSPVIVAPYDAELFGHWWREGIDWLVAARRALEHAGVAVATASEAIAAAGELETADLPSGSWGAGGDFRVWDNAATQPLWEAVRRAQHLFAGASRVPATRARRRVVDQLRRTVLLIESSDWPFLVTTGSAAEYAASRVVAHLADAEWLATLAGRLGERELEPDEEDRVAELEHRDRVWLP